jgi:hypothetical protein
MTSDPLKLQTWIGEKARIHTLGINKVTPPAQAHAAVSTEATAVCNRRLCRHF